MLRVYIVLISLLLGACEESKDFHYQALNNVGVEVVVSDVEASSQGGTLVLFKFSFNNESENPVNFDFNKVSMLVNGKSPQEIYYDSPVSYHWPTYVLKRGYSEHQLKVHLPTEKLSNEDVIEFIVVNFGLREKK